MATLLQTFRNSIGDIAVPDYSSWEKAGDWKYPAIMTAIWFLWFMNLLINLILLLNFLIAVISQVYDQVVAQSQYCSYTFKATFNREYFIIKSQITVLKTFRFLAQTHNVNKDYE